jgi:glycine oxidase
VKIIVVGAGVVGCAVAHELASRGARVRVIDSRGTGRGATRASAGMLAPHIEGHIAPLHALGVRSLGMYDGFVARVNADSGHAVEYERTGTLQLAASADEAAQLCAAARLLANAGTPYRLLDAAETRRMEPRIAAGVTRGLHVPDHGYVAAGPLTRALAAAAVACGADLMTIRATAIEGGDAPRVVAADATLSADAVVIAAGSWSGGAADASGIRYQEPGPPGPQSWPSPEAWGPRPGASSAVKPIRGQLLQLRLPSRAASCVIWGSGCYMVPWRDGSVLVGATVEDVGFDETATVSGVRHLLEASAALLPALSGAVFDEVRVGLRPMTRDELPAIGRSSTMRNVFYATGHYRNGVLLAPLTARLIADLVLDGREDAQLALVRPDRLGL